MSEILDDLELLLASPPTSVRALYERVAPRYEGFRTLWLRLAGRPAEEAMLADLRETLGPGQRVLDAGAGTGAIARQIHALEPKVELTLVDFSAAMLARASDVPGQHLVGDVLELPFSDDSFDLVVSAWVIETVSDPLRAVREYLRVLAPTGHLFYSFCSLPEGWLSRAGSSLLRAIVEDRFAGKFLSAEETPWHDCDRSHRRRFHGGVTSEIALRKCCSVGPEIVGPTGVASAGSGFPTP